MFEVLRAGGRAPTCAVFDFDGTVSWLRHGWPELMAGIFRSHCQAGGRSPKAPRPMRNPLSPRLGRTGRDIAALPMPDVPELPDFKPDILRLNGKPTIHQMRQFFDWANPRGYQTPSPEELLAEYQTALDETIATRVAELRSGRKRVDDFLVHGVEPFLAELDCRGIRLVILSGSVEHRVREEAQWLGVSGYFGRHIYGSPEHGSGFSKRLVLDRLVNEENLKPGDLLAFGDGPVEIEETKNLGGWAVGVASDEDEHHARALDPVKRELLARAGADILVADFRDGERLCREIFGS